MQPDLQNGHHTQRQSYWSRNWHLLYFVLASFDLIAIGISLFLSHQSLEKYDAAVSFTESEMKIQNQIVALGRAAQKSNAPGNDVFDSKDPDQEKKRFDTANQEFDQELQNLRILLQRTNAAGEASRSEIQTRALNEISRAMTEMREVARQIFTYFRQERPERAGELMALMDRRYAELQGSIDQLRLSQLQIISISLIDHRQNLLQNRRIELYFGLCVLLVVIGISLFGRRLNRFVKAALASAKRNEEILAAVSESAIVAFTDTKGTITEVNENFCKISGYTREELIGKNHRILNSGLHSREFFRDLWNTISSGKPWTGDLRNRAKNGDHYFVRTVIAPLRGVNDEIDSYMAVRFDVTQQKNIEIELLQAQARAKIGSWSFDLRTAHQVWSPETYRIFEIEEPQAMDRLHQLYRKRIHPGDVAKLDKILNEAIHAAKDFAFEHRISLDGGKRIKHVRGIGTVKTDSTGKPMSLSGTCQDLTDVVALREQNKFILESMGIGIWKFNPKSGDLHWDESMYRLFEVDPADFSGHYRAWESLLSPEAKKRATEELQDALDGKKPFDTTFEIVTRKGIRKHIGGRGVVIRNEFGEPIEMLGINWDRTREVELEGLLDLEKAKSLHTAKLASLGEMSAGIAHEINNPLAIISGNLPLLEKARGDQAQFESKIATLSRSIARIEKIVKGLRKFSRTSDPFTKSTENLDKIIQEALTITGAKSRRHSTPVETYFDGALHIDCDPVEIEQVFGNLISNAIDAVKTSDERWVKIYAQSDDTHVTVRCMDSGKGIPAEIAQKLFQPFFTTKPVGEGTGLGLSISKGILDHHQASLTLVQDSPHTCFEIRFSKSRSVPAEIKETAQVGLKPETHADLIQVHRSILT